MSDWQAFWDYIENDQRADQTDNEANKKQQKMEFILYEIDGIELEIPA